VGIDADHVVPGACGGPHLVVLQQVGVDEDAQMGLVAERKHAADGLRIRSAAQRRDERLRLHACLAKYSTQRPTLDLTMQGHDTAN
jgi:hypothetical protein